MVMSTAVLAAGGLATPVTKKLAPGTHSVTYGGETVTFATGVFLQVEFRMMGSVNAPTIEIKATAITGHGGPQGVAGEAVQIYWEDQGEELYSGEPPTVTWTGEIQGEGGWTEK